MIFGAPPRARTGSPTATIAIAMGATASASFTVFCTSECLLLLKLRDRLGPTGFCGGIGDRIAGMQLVQRRGVLHLELLGSAAGIGSDGTALRLLYGDGAIDPVKLGDLS